MMSKKFLMSSQTDELRFFSHLGSDNLAYCHNKAKPYRSCLRMLKYDQDREMRRSRWLLVFKVNKISEKFFQFKEMMKYCLLL